MEGEAPTTGSAAQAGEGGAAAAGVNKRRRLNVIDDDSGDDVAAAVSPALPQAQLMQLDAASGDAAGASHPAAAHDTVVPDPWPWAGDSEWVPAEPSGRGVLPEYRTALAKIVFAPAVLATSGLGPRLAALALDAQLHPLPEMAETAALFVQHAYGLPSLEEAREHVASAPEFDTSGSAVDAIVAVAEGLSADGVLLAAALRALTKGDDAEGAALVVGLLLQAAEHCEAQQRDSFTAIVLRTPLGVLTRAATVGELGGAAGATNGGAAQSAAGHLLSAPPGSSGSGGNLLSDARSRIFAAGQRAVDDLKDRAFAASFVRPLDKGAAADDVHGTNAAAAMLGAAFGIRLTRWRPFVDLEDCFCFDNFAQEADFAAQLPVFWADSSLEQAPTRVRAAAAAAVAAAEVTGAAGFDPPPPHDSETLQQIHFIAATNPSFEHTPSRVAFAPYLDRYARYLDEGTGLARVFSILSRDDAVLRDLNTLARSMGLIDADSDDVRNAVWDLAAEPVLFRASVARQLLAAAGIARPISDQLLPQGDPAADAAASPDGGVAAALTAAAAASHAFSAAAASSATAAAASEAAASAAYEAASSMMTAAAQATAAAKVLSAALAAMEAAAALAEHRKRKHAEVDEI